MEKRTPVHNRQVLARWNFNLPCQTEEEFVAKMNIQWTQRPHLKITRSCRSQTGTHMSHTYHYMASQGILDPRQATQTHQFIWVCDSVFILSVPRSSAPYLTSLTGKEWKRTSSPQPMLFYSRKRPWECPPWSQMKSDQTEVTDALGNPVLPLPDYRLCRELAQNLFSSALSAHAPFTTLRLLLSWDT